MSALPKVDVAIEVDAIDNTHTTARVSCQKPPTITKVEDVVANTTKTSQVNPTKGPAKPSVLCDGFSQAWASLSRFIVRCEDRWIWEILGCFLAVACLIAVIAILASTQGSPLSEQDPLSINAWVSIFTAVMKAAIMLVLAEGTY